MAEITSQVSIPHPPPPPPPPPPLSPRPPPLAQEIHPISYQQKENYWLKYLNYQSDWLERTRGNLMVVATVIATMSLQIAVNPPGGVWQTNASFNDGCPIQTCKAGTSVLSYTHHNTYIYLIVCSTVSFSASLSIILLLTSGFPLKNKLTLGLLMISMSLAVLFTAGSFMISIILVRGGNDDTISNIAVYYGVFWFGLLVVLILYHLVQLVIWLLKKFVEGIIWVVKMIFMVFIYFPFWVVKKLFMCCFRKRRMNVQRVTVSV